MILNRGKRKRVAYFVSFKILTSYLWLLFRKRIFGKKYFDKRIEALHIQNANRLKDAFLKLNGLFIKMGQMMSIMSNQLPNAYAEILESLQDNTPSSKFDIIKTQIELCYKKPIDKIFKKFSETPIASASIGQVHKATLMNNDKVIVKIQHPYIQELATVDLNIIEKILSVVQKLFKISGFEHVFGQVRQMIEEELDYQKEAASMKIIFENCKNIKGILIPKVYDEFTSKKIVIIEFFEGVKITNLEQIQKWGLDVNEISKTLVIAFSEMILNHGCYHADPHPGNLLITKKGDIVLIDFGAVGQLSKEMPNHIAHLTQAIVLNDQGNVIKILRKMGLITKGKNAEETATKIINAVTKFMENGININNIQFEDVKGSSIDDLRKELSLKDLTSTIQIPKDFILLERTMMLLQGVIIKISPDYDPMVTIKPILRTMVLKNIGLKNIITDILKKQVGAIASLPTKTNTFLTKANKGELQFTLKDYNKNTHKIYAGLQQIGLILLMITGFVMAFFSKMYGFSDYEWIGKTVGGIASVLIVYSVIKNYSK